MDLSWLGRSDLRRVSDDLRGDDDLLLNDRLSGDRGHEHLSVVSARLERKKVLLTLLDDGSSDTSSFLRKLEEVSLGWCALLDDLPLLFDGDSVDDGGSLIDVEGSDDGDLGVVELRDVDVEFLGRSDLLHLSVSDKRNVDQMLSSDSVLRNINVSDLRKIN